MVPHSLTDDNSMTRVSHQRGVVGDKRGGVDSVSQGGVMGENRGVVSGVGDNRGVVGGRGVGGLRMGLSLVSHISDKPILVICVIGHNLDTTVRELHSVLSYKSL